MPTDEVLTRRLAEGVQVRLEPVLALGGQNWRCLVRESSAEEWTTLHPAHPGFATPGLATTDTDKRITDWLAARREAVFADVVVALREDRLEKVAGTDPEGNPVQLWRAKDKAGPEGVWGEPQPTPEAAVADAKKPRPAPTPTTPAPAGPPR